MNSFSCSTFCAVLFELGVDFWNIQNVLIFAVWAVISLSCFCNMNRPHILYN